MSAQQISEEAAKLMEDTADRPDATDLQNKIISLLNRDGGGDLQVMAEALAMVAGSILATASAGGCIHVLGDNIKIFCQRVADVSAAATVQIEEAGGLEAALRSQRN